MLPYTPPGLGMSPTQNGVGNYSQQNLGQLMPWGANPYAALNGGMQQISQQGAQQPMWGGGGMQGGMPGQNLAMFGQAAQQPMGGPPQMGGGNSYLMSILQALHGGAGQQQQVQVPNPMAWQPGAGTGAPAAQPQSGFISSLGQIGPPAAAAPAADPFAGMSADQAAYFKMLYQQALDNRYSLSMGGGLESGGNGNGGDDTGGASAESGGGSP